MATVVLDRLVRSGQEPMASVVLDFAGGRRDGPRRSKAKPKLRAKKDARMKAPRKQLAKLNGPSPEKPRRDRGALIMCGIMGLPSRAARGASHQRPQSHALRLLLSTRSVRPALPKKPLMEGAPPSWGCP